MKKPKQYDRLAAMALARMWNKLDPSHFDPYLNPDTERHSFWVSESLKGKEQILNYYAAKMNAVRSAKESGGKIEAEVCAIGKGPFVFSSTKSPLALAKAREMEEKLGSPTDSFCVLLRQWSPAGEKNEVLITLEIDRGLLTSYCYSNPGLFRYRPLGIKPGITTNE